MSEFTLYTTEGCHLCELAETLCAQAELEVQFVDIVDDENLMNLYGIRIPVLKHMKSERELGWPFDLPHLLSWLEHTL